MVGIRQCVVRRKFSGKLLALVVAAFILLSMVSQWHYAQGQGPLAPFAFASETVLVELTTYQNVVFVENYVRNQASQRGILRWRVVGQSLPPGWDTYVCDCADCFGSGVLTDTTYIALGDSCPLKVAFMLPDPGNVSPAIAQVQMVIFDPADSSGTMQQAVYQVRYQGVTSVRTAEVATSPAMYEVRVQSDHLVVWNQSNEPVRVALFDILGNEILAVWVAPRTQTVVPHQVAPGRLVWIVLQSAGTNRRYIQKVRVPR